MSKNPSREPISPAISGLRDWRLGAIRGYRKAAEFSGLSQHEIRDAADSGEIVWFPHKERGDRMISKRSLIEYLARLCVAQQTTGASARDSRRS